jgi:hypothetical protein
MLKKAALCLLMTSVAATAMAQGLSIEKYWERGNLVDPAGDNVRNMGVNGDIIAMIDRNAGADAIKLYNATTGLPNIARESVDMGTIPAGLYNIVAGDFSEDGGLFVCNLAHSSPMVLKLYYWADINSAPVEILGASSWLGYRMGDSLDVSGRVDDNTVSVMISGNNAASRPAIVTTTDNGATWTSTTLANTVRAQDIDQVAGGNFYATYAGGNFILYNADGTVNTDLAIGSSLSAVGVDEANGVIYGIGYKDGLPYLHAFDLAGNPLDSLGSDPIDANGVATTGYFNGSTAVELDVTPGGATRIFAMSERQGVARYSYSTSVDVPGDYATIQGAIAAFPTTATMPYIVSVDPAFGPYDEEIDLYSAELPGDIVIKSSTSDKVLLAAQPDAGGDALTIMQSSASVILKDLVIYESLSGAAVTDEIVRVDETAANNDFNWIEMYGVVISDINTSGTPMVTNRADAFNPPVASGSQRTNGFASALQAWGDAGESISLLLEDVIIYGNPVATSWASSNFRYGHSGQDGEQLYMHNFLLGWDRVSGAGSFAGIRSSTGTGLTSLIRVSGDPIENGALTNGSVFLPTAWHSWYCQSSGIVKIDNLLGANTGRTFSGGSNVDLSLNDSIFYNSGAGAINVVMGLSNYAQTFERCTFYDDANHIFVSGVGQELTLKDCIFAGAGSVFSNNVPDVNVVNTAFVAEGPDAIAGAGAYNMATTPTIVTGDPIFASKDIQSADLLDVASFGYNSAATGGAPLVGGANMADLLYEVGADSQIAIGAKADAYDQAGTVLAQAVSAVDVIEGIAGTVTSGGFHGAYTGTTVPLTNGVFDSDGLTVLGADTDGTADASFAVEYTMPQAGADITGIRIFSGHDSGGDRAFINAGVEIDTGVGYAPLTDITTGAFGIAKPNNSAAAYAEWTGSALGVIAIRVTFENVSHNSTGFFQAAADNTTAPPTAYPNQATIVKEIDVFGTILPGASVNDWMILSD